MVGPTPRAVFVTRETDYELLLARHATRAQARFFLESRGQTLAAVEDAHERFDATLKAVRGAVPGDWRQALVRRPDLDRFLFAPDDLIVAVGQDGLVANVAKYLDGQSVLGVNPDPARFDGVLACITAERVGALLPAAAHHDVTLQRRTMVEAQLDNGDRLLALNEIFVGHRSHQSARYRLAVADRQEDQSSSGLIVCSGTGATGWARSIMEASGLAIPLTPEERALAWFVREPFPSIATGTTLRAGRMTEGTEGNSGGPLAIVSRMNDGGTIFADGMEQDHLAFDWGRTLTIRPAARTLNLVTA